MSAKAAFILDLKKAVPDVEHDGIETAWEQELELRAAEAEREDKRLAAEREDKRLAAEREHELAKMRIGQQRDGDGKFFVSCVAFVPLFFPVCPLSFSSYDVRSSH
jgi:hypothetical protein